MRIGQIITLIHDRKFGFIRSQHFREDVFFHYNTLKDVQSRFLKVGMDVEFEIDELLRINKQKLEAIIVQIPARPLTKTLIEEEIPEFRASHHPKARRRRPTWKPRVSDEQAPESSADSSQSDGTQGSDFDETANPTPPAESAGNVEPGEASNG